MAADREKKYRHELKYLITAAQMEILKARAQALLQRDMHAGGRGTYHISSLYFDDFRNSCYHENEDGTDPREKFRIRIYNHSPERISLECKRKERTKTLKSACVLSGEQASVLLGNGRPDIPPDADPVYRKFCTKRETAYFRPAVIVDYDRIPFVCAAGNVRVTFDINIAASPDTGLFLEPRFETMPVLPAGTQLLEVKFDEFLPDYIYQGLQLDSLQRTSFSKYYMCRKALLHRTGV